MKLKRILSMILVLTLVMSLGVTTAFADGWGNGKIPPGQAKKIFADIDNYSWAEDAIETMFAKGLIKGYGNGIFKPQGSVTKMEAVIMALRIMGWEQDAITIKDLPKIYKGQKVDNWAVGYVALAHKKGILDDVDMMYFNPREAVKRFEVAKYIIRAIGMEEDAQDAMDEELPFKDAALVPQGAVGYVYLINEEGLMQGDTLKRFNPMGVMNRAEMAVLFLRLNGYVERERERERNHWDDEIEGVLTNIGRNYIEVLVDDDEERFYLSDDIDIEIDGKDADLDELLIGMEVELKLDDDEYVVEIEAESLELKFEGEIIDIDDDELTIEKKNGAEVTYEVSDDVKIEIDGVRRPDFDDLLVGDYAKFEVLNNLVVKIEVIEEEIEQEEVEGIFKALSDDEDSIIVVVSGKEKVYPLANIVEIYVRGYDNELESLKTGMRVELLLEDGEVISIDARDNQYTLKGKILEISTIRTKTQTRTMISLQVGKQKYLFSVDEDVEIEIDDEEADLDELLIGDQGEFEIVNTSIVRIEIED